MRSEAKFKSREKATGQTGRKRKGKFKKKFRKRKINNDLKSLNTTKVGIPRDKNEVFKFPSNALMKIICLFFLLVAYDHLKFKCPPGHFSSRSKILKIITNIPLAKKHKKVNPK